MEILGPALVTVGPFIFELRPDGWIHVAEDAFHLLSTPFGVVVYLALVPIGWACPRRWLPAWLILSGAGVALVTVGHAYVFTLFALACIGYALIRFADSPLASPEKSPDSDRPGPRRRIAAGVWCVLLVALLLDPQPRWLPPVGEPRPLYFYLQWAGVAYLFLRVYHLLVDLGSASLNRPHFHRYLAFLFFAPTLRMGPIMRYADFASQLDAVPRFPPLCDIGRGAARLAVGLVRFGVMLAILNEFDLARLFESPEQFTWAKRAGVIYAAPFSIYLWLSGYTDLAVGIGAMMGFRVPENFAYPFFAVNIAEFWRRWHITLGLWLRDYVYIPLGGSRRRVRTNYLATFLFCGAWHGLYASAVLWGISQGVALALRRTFRALIDDRRERQPVSNAFGPVYGALTRFAAWCLTFHYQMVTITLFMDEHHTGSRIFPSLLSCT